MQVRSVLTKQPLPKPGEESVHDELVRLYGQEGNPAKGVVDDLLARAELAQVEYKLDKVGLYTFNGRSALRDMYDDLSDAVIYCLQYLMECERERVEPVVSRWKFIDLMVFATNLREELVNRGELDD